ncbi:hypothetical protein AD998_08245 [bacterium 336/3]|nr:hypothetical protein AD998_08245 [bacterium 336/3]
MIIPKRKAEDYTPPAIINEYDQIHVYIKEGKNLTEVKGLMPTAMPDEQIEKIYMNVLKHTREARDKKRGVIAIGLFLFFMGLWLGLRNIGNILKQMSVKSGDENFYVTTSFFEFQHPFWLLLFGTMVVAGMILLVNGLFTKIRI